MVPLQEEDFFPFSLRKGESVDGATTLLLGRAPSSKVHHRPNISQAMKEEEGKKRGADDHPSPV